MTFHRIKSHSFFGPLNVYLSQILKTDCALSGDIHTQTVLKRFSVSVSCKKHGLLKRIDCSKKRSLTNRGSFDLNFDPEVV